MAWDSENIVKYELPKVAKTIEKYLRPKDRGFELVYMGAVLNSLPSILYQSRQCKMRIQSNRDRPHEEIELYLSYGRLHAPLETDVMEWNKEKCYCWHSLSGSCLLPFLDGLSPTDIDNREFALPRVYTKFGEANKDLGCWPRSVFLARQQAFIWDYYGERLFDLFDLKHSALWEDYALFLKEYYKISDERDRQKNIRPYPYDPPKYMVC